MCERKSGDQIQNIWADDSQERLTADLEEIRVTLAKRDAKIYHLKAQVQQLSSEGSGTTDVLKAENENLKTQATIFTGEIKGLNDELKNLTKQLLNAHATGSTRMLLVLCSFAPKPPTS